MKKIIIILLILTLLSSCYAVANTIKLEPNQKTIYVDDDAEPEWYDDLHYRYIMDAINSSDAGDTIFVYNGTYYEKLNITKTIKLIGEDKYNTYIDGSYIQPNIFNISIIQIFNADEITVSGFTIQNNKKDTEYIEAGLFIVYSNNNIITNNIFLNISDEGIYIGNSNNNIITNNIFRNIDLAGLRLYGFNQMISDNIIKNSHIGIWYIGNNNEYTNSTITNNTITNIVNEGISLWSVNGITITRNNITYTFTAIDFSKSRRNLIECNNIAHNAQGVCLTMSGRNKFYKNNFIDNKYKRHVQFKGYSFFNRWRRNYWDNQIIHGLPKIIIGRFGILPIPWLKFDLRPAREPYDIYETLNEK